MHFFIVGDNESWFREGTYFTILNKAYVEYFTHRAREESFKAIKCLCLINGPFDLKHVSM